MQPIRLFAIVLLLCGGLVAAEGANPLTLEQLEAIAIQPAQNYAETNSRVVPEMLPLFKAEKIVYTGKNRYHNTELGFRLHVPENMEPGKKYPLILWLHGVGEAGTDNKDQLVHLHHIITYLTGPKKRDFFLLVPQTPKDHTGWDAYTTYSYGPQGIEESGMPAPSASNALRSLFGAPLQAEPPSLRVVVRQREPVEVEEPFEDSPLGFSFAMLDQVIANYPVDTDRVTVAGLSSGGDGTWRALERRPNQFAAAVPLVSWNALKAKAIEEHPVLKKVPIWAIYSSDDNGIDRAREDFARVEAAGCNVKKSEFGVCGHNAWTPAMLQADIFSWLLSRAKKDGEYVAVFDANVNPEDMKGVIEVAQRAAGMPTLAPSIDGRRQTADGREEMQRQQYSLAEERAATVEARSAELQRQQALQGMETTSPLVPAPPEGVVVGMTDITHGMPTVVAQRERVQQPVQYNTTKPIYEQVKPPTPVQGYIVEHPNWEPRVIAMNSAPHPIYPVYPVDPEIQAAKDRLNARLAHRYLEEGDVESFKRIVGKLSVQERITMLGRVLANEHDEYHLSSERLKEIEELIDQIAEPEFVPSAFHFIPEPQVPAPIRGGSLSGSKIVEECDREWAMTSTSLYGMFPADWNKEGQRIPDFVVKSTAQELLQLLHGDPEKLKLACDSILTLAHRPMSSPWFETSGGRLHSDIMYTLSDKGRILVALLNHSEEDYAKKTREKIEAILSSNE